LKRRKYLELTGFGMGSMLVPVMGNSIPVPLALEQRIDASQKKKLADVALNTARSMGATYADVRIGRYLNQFLTTRENKVHMGVCLDKYCY
jgi:TldD protein